MDEIYNLVDTKRILVWSEFAVVRYKYFSPNNTTEYLGVKNLFHTLSQIYNSIEIYSMIIHNQDLSKNAIYDKIKFKTVEDYLDNNIQSCIADPLNKNIVKCVNFSLFLLLMIILHSLSISMRLLKMLLMFIRLKQIKLIN